MDLSRKNSLKNLCILGCVALIYYFAAKGGLKLASLHVSSTLVWPPSGIALAAVLFFGARVWPGIFLGALLINLQVNLSQTTSWGTASWTAAGIALGNTVEALLGGFLVERFASGRNAFARSADILKFVLLAPVLSAAVSATIGVTCITLGGFSGIDRFIPIWLTWWLGDAEGMLTVTPLLVVWSRVPRLHITRTKAAEALAFIVALAAMAQISFGGWLPASLRNYPLIFLQIPVLMWAAFRFGQHGATFSIALLSGLAIWATIHGAGPFAAIRDRNTALLLLQAFMGTISVSTLVLTALIEERNASESHRRKQAEEALKTSEERFRFLVENIKDYAIFLLDADGIVITWNQGAVRIKGYTAQEIIGRHFSIFFPPEDIAAGKPQKELEIAVSQGRAEDEGWRVRKDGSRLWANVVISALREPSGRLRGFAKVTRDITEKKKVQEALEKSRDDLEKRVEERTAQLKEINQDLLKEISQRKRAEAASASQAQELIRSNEELEQFAYMASHDLQEPLRMVASYTELLARRYKDKLDADANDFIGYAVSGATRMKEMINDLLNYSRLNTQKKPFEIVDSGVVFERAVENLRIAIREKNAVVTRDPLPKVKCDFILLGELFQNLISNGIKFNKSERPSVHVTAEVNGSETVFCFQDNGIGIDPKYHERIFGIFQRLHNKDEYNGTGLGLTACKKIVERHGGRIWVDSKPDQGSTFCFSIPREDNGS